MQELRIGCAYHSNRLLKSVREDMEEIVANGFDTVIHMLTHNDWRRCPSVCKDIFSYTKELGLDFWVDNWGLMGAPGDPCHFLSYHPEAARRYSDGSLNAPFVCLNNPEYIKWSKEWIDLVYDCGGRKIFWDEPFLKSDEEKFACGCPVCKELFKKTYNREMPVKPDDDCIDFQVRTIINYFKEVTAYSASKGMINSVCVMPGGRLGINLDNIHRLCEVENMNNVGTDPYWSKSKPECTGAWVYKYVYERAKKAMDVCNGIGRDHNIWIKAYDCLSGRERDVVYAAEAAYDAGARNIFFWGFRGCDGNEYRSDNPLMHWAAVGEAVARLREKERAAIVSKARAELGLK